VWASRRELEGVRRGVTRQVRRGEEVVVPWQVKDWRRGVGDEEVVTA
jgi:hypothetical protein